jgi:hypothetical protein
MTDQFPEAPPPAAPPVRAGQLGVPPRRPVWPTVVGVICIVYGAFSVLGTIFGQLVSRMVPTPAPGEDPEVDAAMMAAIDNPAWQAMILVSGIGLAVLLIAAGVGLVQRRRWSIPTAKVWSWATIVISIISTVYMAYVMNDMLAAAAAANQAGGGGPPPAAMGAMMVGGAIFGLLWALLLPVFLLIWLSRGTIKAQVAGWR